MTPSGQLPFSGLYVVATPLGNLGDMTPRALDTLRTVDVIAAEDTRTTQSLLNHFGIRARLIAVHEHNETPAADGIVKLLREGKSVALVTDAGTPGISDPGARVVAAAHEAGCRVVPVAGASAVAAAVSASGEGEGGFLFHGFLPVKSGERRAVLQSLAALPYTLVFYESPHRIEDTLNDIAATLEASRTLVIARELTKKFESIHRGIVAAGPSWLMVDDNNRRGEFTLVIGPPLSVGQADAESDAVLEDVLGALLDELPVKQAVGLAVRITGRKKNAVYDCALAIQRRREGSA